MFMTKKILISFFIILAMVIFACTPDDTTYTVTYYPNGAERSDVPVDNNEYLSGDEVIVLGNTEGLSKSGFYFSGWNTEQDGSGDSYIEGDSIIIDENNIELYAQWSEIRNYSVIYEPNGAESGNVPIDENDYISGDEVIVLGNTGNLEKSGFSFNGWNTEQDGSGDAYTEGSSFNIGHNDVILYAQWNEIPTYTVTYDPNGAEKGDVPIDENEYYTNDEVAVLGNVGRLEKPDYVFSGWNSEQDGSGDSYTEGSILIIEDSDVVLYAQWEYIPTYTVTYDSNEADSGNVPIDENEYYEEDNVIVLGNTGNLQKSGFSFMGWNTSQDGSGDGYTEGNTFQMGSSDVVLYAQWSALPVYIVTFDSQGGSDVNSQSVMQGQLVSEPDDPTKVGHTFSGWYTDLGYTTLWDFDTDTVSEDTTLYANWTVISYTVTFELNEGSPSIPQQTVDYGQKVSEPAEPSKDGFLFEGWYEEAGLLNQWDFDTDTVSEDITLYAKWFDVMEVNDDTLSDADWDFYEGRDISFSVTNLTGNDHNYISPGGLIEVISVSNATNGTVTLNGTTITFNGQTQGSPASFEYTARVVYDTVNYEETATVSIEQVIAPPPVIAGNDGPYEMNQSAEMVLAVSDLLSNDIGEDGTNTHLQFVEVVSGSEVNLSVIVDGNNITVTSTGPAYTSAEFQYQILDTSSPESATAIGTVFFDIGPLPETESYVFIDSTLFDDFKANNIPDTFEDIFNNWGRFDGNTVYANKAEADAAGSSSASWELLDAGTENERVRMPLNVDPYNGFFSDEEIENYTFEATLYSNDNDNDTISLIIAYAEVGGTPYALSAARSGTGASPNDGWGIIEGETGDSLDYNDDASSLVQSISLSGQRSRWGGYYTRVKIERTGDIVKVWTTDFTDTQSGALSLSYLPESYIELDLSSDPRFDKYRGAKPYGYGTFSQPNSTYLDVEFTGGLDTQTTIMLTSPEDTDLDGTYDRWNDSEVWKYTGSSWEIVPGVTIQDELGYPRQVTFPGGESYFIREFYVDLVID